MAALTKTDMPDLKRIYSGKVRDVYEVEGNLLMISTDRLSAFDVVMSKGVPDRGKMLTEISLFWFDYFKDTIGSHLITADVDKMPEPVRKYRDQLEGRTMYVKRAEMLKVECVARGYIVGSGWKDYQKTGAVCGHKLPEGMKLAQKLEKPLFTPATKADQGEHDENIDFDRAAEIVGKDMATRLRELTLDIFTRAGDYAREKGIIIADTKFEFGMIDGELAICDEMLSPDSSRFWDAKTYEVGKNPESFDKQIVRDWLETQPWNKQPPPPEVPDEIINKTAARYREVIDRLKG
ncbi:MAG: phosphoribosylaminoimidazolesuccinocarboxamide synthase [Planctomycetes bacterium]|nr:phosphoribosylaminoimidazolesuccinocarboxamide synthase [Planctomycetota bacterium]